jgi:hypothetical protein
LRNWLELSAILFIALTTQAETKPSGQGKPEFFVAQGTLRQILAPGMPTISDKKRTGRFDFLLERKGGWTLLAQTDDDNYRRIYTLDRTNLLTAVFEPNSAAAALATREPANFLPNTDLTFGGLIITALTGRLGDSEHTTSPLWISHPDDRLSGPKYAVRPWLANQWASGTKKYQIFDPESPAMPVAILKTEAWSSPYGFDYPSRVLMERMSDSTCYSKLRSRSPTYLLRPSDRRCSSLLSIPFFILPTTLKQFHPTLPQPTCDALPTGFTM